MAKFLFDLGKTGMALTRIGVSKAAFFMSVPSSDVRLPSRCFKAEASLSSSSCSSTTGAAAEATPIAFWISSACSFMVWGFQGLVFWGIEFGEHRLLGLERARKNHWWAQDSVSWAQDDGPNPTCSSTHFSLSARASGPSVSNFEKLQELRRQTVSYAASIFG